MAMRILVTRPREDAQETAQRLAELGHQALPAPLLFTHFQDRPAPDLTGVQALLATSANGVRAFARLSDRRDLPLFAVGPQTSQTARQAGFARVENADGAVAELVALAVRLAAPDKGALLHLRGEPGRQGLPEQLMRHGFEVRSETLYDVRAADRLPPDAADALRQGTVDAVLFYSPRSAQIFAGLLHQAGLNSRALIAVCISPATAAELPPGGFREVRIAARPNQDALLALLA